MSDNRVDGRRAMISGRLDADIPADGSMPPVFTFETWEQTGIILKGYEAVQDPDEGGIVFLRVLLKLDQPIAYRNRHVSSSVSVPKGIRLFNGFVPLLLPSEDEDAAIVSLNLPITPDGGETPPAPGSRVSFDFSVMIHAVSSSS